MTPGPGSDPTFDKRPFTGRQWLVIGAVTVVAAALRLLQLGEWSFWVDEAHTWRDATMPLHGEGGFMETARRIYLLPFFLLRLLFGFDLIGYDEGSVRLPFAVIGIVTVPLLAICGRRFAGGWPSVFAAALLAVSPWHIFWSQNARGYAMVVLGSVLLMHRLHLLCHSGRALDLLLAALFAAFAVGSHTTAVAMLLAFVGFLVLRAALRRRFGALVIVLLALVIAGPMPWLVRHFELFPKFLSAKGETSLLHWFETVVYYFRPPLLLTALLAMAMAPRLLGRERSLYLTCMAIVPLFVFTAAGAQLTKVTARYAICALPAILLLSGLLLGEVARRVGRVPDMSPARRWLLAAVLPALVVGDLVNLDVAYYTEQHGQRGMWRQASEFLRAEAKARGLDGVRCLTDNHPTMLYYLRRKHWFVGDEDPHPDMDVSAVLTWRFLDGVDHEDNVLHEPGVDAHFDWHLRAAARANQLFAVPVTLPELREYDHTGEFEAALKRRLELALYLPSWVGPKDESIYIYLPKKAE